MWPFNHKTLPGFKYDNKGSLTFSLTNEEQKAIEEMFNMTREDGKVLMVKKEYEDEIQKGTSSLALKFYAKQQMFYSTIDSLKDDRKLHIEKALAAISKAYSFYPLPIYLYELAHYMEVAGKNDAAIKTFTQFLDSQSAYKVTPIGESIMNSQEIDINEAINEASMKLGLGNN